MATRSNIVIKDNYDTFYLYRHWDGYPSSVLDSLKTFFGWMRESKMRTSQAAGWILVEGHRELNCPATPDNGITIGAYEITTDIHGDIDWLYTIDLEARSIKVEYMGFSYKSFQATIKATDDLEEKINFIIKKVEKLH